MLRHGSNGNSGTTAAVGSSGVVMTQRQVRLFGEAGTEGDEAMLDGFQGFAEATGEGVQASSELNNAIGQGLQSLGSAIGQIAGDQVATSGKA